MFRNKNQVENFFININNITIVIFNIGLVIILIIIIYSLIFKIYLQKKQQGGRHALKLCFFLAFSFEILHNGS